MLKKCFLLTCAGVAASFAGTISAASYLQQIVLCGSGGCQILAASPGQTASFTGMISGTGINVTANTNVAPGVLRAFATYTATGLVAPYSQLNAAGQVSDVLIITAPGMTGQLGYLSPSYTVTGSATGFASGQISMLYNDSFNNAGPVQATGGGFFTGPGVFSFGRIPFHYGSPLGLYTVFGAALFLANNGSGTADFSHTAILTGLPVFADQGGTQPVAGVNYGVSELGATYTPAGVVPEPASILLMAVGITLLALRRRARSAKDGSNTLTPRSPIPTEHRTRAKESLSYVALSTN